MSGKGDETSYLLSVLGEWAKGEGRGLKWHPEDVLGQRGSKVWHPDTWPHRGYQGFGKGGDPRIRDESKVCSLLRIGSSPQGFKARGVGMGR